MSNLTANSLVTLNVGEMPLGLTAIVLPDLPPDDPNELKEYVVTVKKGKTISQLENDLRRDTAEDDGVDSSIVPDRPVLIANARELSERQTHFSMTWAEAQALKNHEDVLNVEPANSVIAQTSAVRTQNFEKVGIFASNVGNATNYGLYRCNFEENIFGADPGIGGLGNMTQNLDGTGVDVVIMDDGVAVDHPEWVGPDGRNRFVQIDWYAAANVAGSMPTGYYDDPASGHGTCVASVVAGKTYGWATNANIYSLKTLGSGATIGHAEGLDLVRQWHNNKPINPTTGAKNPTIVNASWDTIAYVLGPPAGGNYDPFSDGGHIVYTGYSLFGGNYRGNAYSYALSGAGAFTMPRLNEALGMSLHSTGYSLGTANVTGNLYYIPGKNDSIDAAVEDLIDAGVTFVHAAGNNQFKNDGPGGLDWDNHANVLNTASPITYTTRYYCRPSTPWANGVVHVGAVDSNVFQMDGFYIEQRASYSNYGTAVDIHAPGTGIVGAWVGTGGEAYYANASYKQKAEQGTSFSSPQVTGVMALFLQLNPTVSAAEAKRWLINKAKVGDIIYDTGSTTDYANTYSLSGGPNRFLYNPYNLAEVRINLDGVTLSNVVPKIA